MTSATCGTRSDVKASLTPRRRGRVVENRPVRRLCPARHRRLQPPRCCRGHRRHQRDDRHRRRAGRRHHRSRNLPG